MLKRIFDIVSALCVLVVLFPFLLVIALIIAFGSRGGIFYKQTRVGKNNVDFKLLKFRSMRAGSDRSGLLTVGNKDPRITGIGRFIRKYKIDEFPQLLNVLAGDMSIVGPRPEVRKYVDMYSDEQRKVLTVRPGLTDYASLEYIDEDELLAASENPEETYIKQIMPAKLVLNLKYVSEVGLGTDLKLIFKTISKIFSFR